MSSTKPMVRKWWKNRASQVLVAALVCAVVSSIPAATAQEAPTVEIMRVEEDWCLYVREPDNLVNAPQFHTVTSPYGNLDSTYFQVTWNYWELPEFVAGGVQMQAWYGDTCTYDQAYRGQELSGASESIVWTQVLETNGEMVWLMLLNGYSSTWGYFGGDTMKIHSPDHIANLNAYDPAVSIRNSWITYGENRVVVLVINAVRYYDGDGVLLYEDDTLRKVYWDIED